MESFQIDNANSRKLLYTGGYVEARENDYGNTVLIFTIDCQNVGRSRNKSYAKVHEIELYENAKRESAIVYIKQKYLEKLQIPLSPDDENIVEVTIFRRFLKESKEILENEYFIPNTQSKLLLAQSFIELLEENNLHLHEYRDTYISLLELNFILAEDNYNPDDEESVDILFYALKKWLNACKDPQNTIFEDEKIDREIEIHRAIFENGKVKTFFVEDKKGKDNNERFRDVLERIGTEWLLKSKYDLKNAYKIFRLRKRFKKRDNNTIGDTNRNGNTEPKLKANWLLHLIIFLAAFTLFLISWLFNVPFILRGELCVFYFGFPTISIVLYLLLGRQLDWIKMIIPRLAGTIVIGYIPLVITAEVWEFSLRYYQQTGEIVVGLREYLAIIITAFAASLIYLFIEVNNFVKKHWLAFRRALSLFLLGATESFVIGLILFDLFADGMTRGLMSDLGINADKIIEIRIDGFFGHIYPLPLILYASLALVIGIFVQIIWEEKPITEPL